ncbi:MAG TPA: Rieske 2Fe-2S domain-containing protein [Candidatus Binatia bacterium]|nr:Rieske 2Fe-2S domain-containing protein [Candidatus Binatia bacterium]
MSPEPVPTGSRLEPEPIRRRDFLGLSALWSAAVALLFGLFGALRLPRAAVVPMASRKFRVTVPDTLTPGEALVPAGRSVAVFRDPDGAVYAISRVCTHLGCLVKSEADGFHCPCHGSRFAPDGSVVKGPAPKALGWLAVAKASAGTVIVDEGKTVAPGTKVTV